MTVQLGERRRVLEAARTWLVAALYDTAMSADKVVFAPKNAASGTGPRFSVQVLSWGSIRGGHGDIHSYQGRWLVASTDAVLRVYAFGEQATEWLGLASARILSEPVRQALAESTRGAQDCVIEAFSDAITESSMYLDSDTEIRAFFDVRVSCRRWTEVVILDLDEVQVDPSVGPSPPGDAVGGTITVDVSEP